MNFQVIGFVGVLALVGFGVDYHQQSTTAGIPLGRLGISEYVDTITGRIDGAKAEKLAEQAEAARKQAWKQGAKPFLPDAPAGWTRRGFDEGDNTAIIPAEVILRNRSSHPASNYLANSKLAPGETLENSKGGGIMAMLAGPSPADVIRDVATRAWVYERNGETVFVELVTHDPLNMVKLAGNAEATLAGIFKEIKGHDLGFAVIGGVGFTEAVDDNRLRANHYRILRGSIGYGQEISIRVHANASTASTREILSAIDYDGLNALLVKPFDHIGNNVVVAGLDEADLAEAMYDLRVSTDRLVAMDAAYRLSFTGRHPLLVDVSEQSDPAMANKGISTEMLIRDGYRGGLQDLLAGQAPSPSPQELRAVLHKAVNDHQAALASQRVESDAKAATMSPALAAELGNGS